jgi:hypothetical protein
MASMILNINKVNAQGWVKFYNNNSLLRMKAEGVSYKDHDAEVFTGECYIKASIGTCKKGIRLIGLAFQVNDKKITYIKPSLFVSIMMMIIQAFITGLEDGNITCILYESVTMGVARERMKMWIETHRTRR